MSERKRISFNPLTILARIRVREEQKRLESLKRFGMLPEQTRYLSRRSGGDSSVAAHRIIDKTGGRKVFSAENIAQLRSRYPGIPDKDFDRVIGHFRDTYEKRRASGKNATGYEALVLEHALKELSKNKQR